MTGAVSHLSIILPPHLSCLRSQEREGPEPQKGASSQTEDSGALGGGRRLVGKCLPSQSWLRKGGRKQGRLALPIALLLHPHACRAVPYAIIHSFIYFLHKGKEWVERVQATLEAISRPKGGIPSANSCLLPQGSQLNYVCEQWKDGNIPHPGDPQLPGPCQQGTGCWDFRNVFIYSVVLVIGLALYLTA